MKDAANLNYRELILAGITENGGQESDLQFIDPAWIKTLGIKAANAGMAFRKEFPRWNVEPICDMVVAIEKSHHSDGIHDKKFRLPRASGTKRVHIVAFDTGLAPLEYLDRLAGHRLQPCIGGPSYLAGLMSYIPRGEMPPKLQQRWIVAAGPQNLIRVDFMGKPKSGYMYASIAPNGHCSFDICDVPPWT